MKYEKFESLYLMIFLLVFTSCGNAENSSEISCDPGEEIHLLKNVVPDYEHAFFDGFDRGVSKDHWYIADQAWGGGNGGVIPENVSYSDSGTLNLNGTGAYYCGDEIRGVGDVKDGRYTGAALISKFSVGPGRYEIKMKVLPRQGACSAFWTFSNSLSDGLNHEIDIELPGGSQKDVVSFENVLNTNYITESKRQSQDVRVSDLTGQNTAFNDGKWHTFGFDWYTSPKKVVYHVDGKISAVSELFVPDMQSRLWLGCWFPVSSAFVGNALFEKDAMQVDYVRYIPFRDQPYTEFLPSVNGVAEESEYPSVPGNIRNISKIANGDFEFAETRSADRGGWTLTKYLDEKKEIEEVASIRNGVGRDGSYGLRISDRGVAYQNVDSVYRGFQHELSFRASGKGKGYVNYYSALATEVLLKESLDIDSDTMKEFSLSVTAPENAQSMRIVFESESGSELVVDDVELYQK